MHDRSWDKFETVHCVTTTNDYLFFERIESISGRPIDWVPLPPPTLLECLALFGLSDRDSLSPVSHCILDCNAQCLW